MTLHSNRKSSAVPSTAVVQLKLVIITFIIISCTFLKKSVSAYTPIGYQFSSKDSIEYRTIDPTSPHTTPIDPSTYAGSIHYDPLHNALYLTGSTYASGVFDGHDVYNVQGEQDQLSDEDPKNNAYWWVDMATGLKPHLLDLGIPQYSPGSLGDCYYAILGLPSDSSNMGGESDGENDIKLVHSRRFGSELGNEACSSIDILFTNPATTTNSESNMDETDTGGYVHDFDPNPNNVDLSSQKEPSQQTEDTFDLMGGDDLLGNPDHTPYPTLAPGSTFSPTIALPTYAPAIAPEGDTTNNNIPYWIYSNFDGDETCSWYKSDTSGMLQGSVAYPSKDECCADHDVRGCEDRTTTGNTFGDDNVAPSPSTNLNTGPQSRFRSLREVKEEEEESKQQQHTLKAQQQQRTLQIPPEQQPAAPPNIPTIETRSVRLLMAGHVESLDNNKGGYIVSDLYPNVNSDATVYAFAQQVDVRLPRGDLEQNQVNSDINEIMNDQNSNLDYNLHTYSKNEADMAMELSELGGDNMQANIPKEEFEKIVTSGVESRALLNDEALMDMKALYPVSLVADPTSKKHYYVVLLASESDTKNEKDPALNNDETIGEGTTQRSWTEYGSPSSDNMTSGIDNFGIKGRPNYGSNYRIIVKKMAIEANVDPVQLSDSEKDLASKSYNGELIAMRHSWMQEFRPDLGDDARPSGILFAPSGKENGEGDRLIMVGTTAGRGSAFGTSSEDNRDTTDTGAPPQREDLDGFITKIRTDTGAFSGGIDFDILTNQFNNMHSKRIQSNPGKNDIVSSVCGKPLRSMGTQDEMEHIYIVGSTEAMLPGVAQRTTGFDDNYDDEKMEAFLMKIDLSTMKTEWTVQVGAVNAKDVKKGNAFGYGCAVTRDGEDVYLTGLVKNNGVVTDFSEEDFQGKFNARKFMAKGGSDVFLSSYKTSDGSLNYLNQVGSTQDDFPSRGNGGITTDRLGNAIITGNTRGSLMRVRKGEEFRYGQYGQDAAMEVFIMSFDRVTGIHITVADDGLAPAPVPQQPPIDPEPKTPTSLLPGNPLGGLEEETKNGALIGMVAFSIAFILVSVGASIFVVYRIKSNKEKNALMDADSNNLHGGLGGRRSSTSRRSPPKKMWGLNNGRSRVKKEDFNDLNIMVEVRNSASGGWHGVYDDEQLQAIDFGVHSGDADDVVEQSLFMEEGLQEIEESLGQYEIGDMAMDDVSDEDLIKAYNDAMAIEIEPENPDVEFAMAGIGSHPTDDNEERPDHRRLPSVT